MSVSKAIFPFYFMYQWILCKWRVEKKEREKPGDQIWS